MLWAAYVLLSEIGPCCHGAFGLCLLVVVGLRFHPGWVRYHPCSDRRVFGLAFRCPVSWLSCGLWVWICDFCPCESTMPLDVDWGPCMGDVFEMLFDARFEGAT